ncbi:MAG TPA: TolC family outer membrane protein [Burkholderiales bacterium]|nr:TolC family outer membrane protein [Burkholderiales bacterium]
MKRILILVATLLAAGPALSADLLAVYREATLQDAVYASAKAQYIAAQERLPQARALLLPNVNFGAGANYNDVDAEFENSTFASGRRDFYDYNYGVTVIQPLYRKQNAVAYEQAKIQVSQAQTQFTVAAQDLMTRVAQAYFDVLLARANLRTIESQKIAVAQQLEQAKRNFVVGTATITDSREAQARYDLVVAQELGAQNEVEVKNRALEQLVGKPAGELAGLTTPITLNAPQPAQMDAWVEQAYQSSLQIALAQQSLELAAREIERASAGHRPTLDAVGSLTHDYASSSVQGIGRDIRALVIGVQLNVPLYQGGAISSRVREAVANQERARQDLENARRSAALQTRQAYLGVTSGLAQVKALQQAVASTQLQLESTKLGQEVGVRTAVDVLNAEQQLSLARSNLAQALYNAILNQLRLKAAVGKLAEADLADINALLTDDAR